MSRTRTRIAGSILVAIIVSILWLAKMAGAVGAGYAAKQLCSGVFVAHLPERFILETDVLPRLATLGPLAGLLAYDFDERQNTVVASMLGQQQTARHFAGYGCTLVHKKIGESSHPTTNPLTAARDSIASPAVARSGIPNLELALDAAFVEPPQGGRNTLAIVVMHRGEIVAERYSQPVNVETPMQGWSMNKSLMATFIGYQVDRAHLRLDASVREALLTAGVSKGLASKIDDNLTLRHLLSMTTGFDFSERYFPGDDVTNMLYREGSMWQSAPKAGHLHPPGRHFSYSSGDINTASLLWQQSLHGEPYPDWISDRFSGPLRLHAMTLEPDNSGIQVGSSYAYLTARDWAQMGQLWLDAWHGRSKLISQQWQRMAVTPGTAEHGEIYGLGFWLNTDQRAFPSAPEATFHAGGNSGQFVVVIPEQELVVVRLGLTLNESEAHLDNLLNTLLATFQSM